MKEMERKFKLTEEQIDFLKKMYPENPLVQRVLNVENNGYFVVDVDTKIDFMDFMEDESIYWMKVRSLQRKRICLKVSAMIFIIRQTSTTSQKWSVVFLYP
jgi:hypothetical protein